MVVGGAGSKPECDGDWPAGSYRKNESFESENISVTCWLFDVGEGGASISCMITI